LDADAAARPDLLGTFVDMRELVTDASFDALWSSHSLEHLYAHEVVPALREFRRILKNDGFALITTPDLEVVAQMIVDGRIDDTAYVSAAGPITPLDMAFGHSAAIALGSQFMSHNTGFTCERLGRLILEAGFPEAHIIRQSTFDLWALAVMPETDHERLIARFRTLGINFAE
jgi:predicted SAM-dependent methyltransferase